MNATPRAPSTRLIRVLLVDDDPSQHRLVADFLDSIPATRFLIDGVRTLADAMDRLEHRQFDICLLDAHLPDGDGLDILNSIGTRGLMLPVVVLTNSPSFAEDQRSLAMGAATYTDKGELYPAKLERIIRYAMQQQQVIVRLARQSFQDEATGLISRALYLERVERALRFARRRHRDVAVMMIDLAFETRYDDREHSVDAVLAAVGGKLTDDLRETDSIARLSDRRLAILIEGIRNLGQAATVARKVLRHLRAPVNIDGGLVPIVPSIGVAIYPREGGDSAALTRQAEAAMCRATAEGGGCCRFSSDQVDYEAREGMVLEKAFRVAFEHRELRLRFRPEIGLSGKHTGLVGEVFWRHPDRGWLSLDSSLSDTDDEALIKGIVDWSLASAAEQLLIWQRDGLEQHTLSLALPFRRPPALAFLERAVLEQVAARQVAPSHITLDLQEDLIIEDERRGYGDLTSLKATGVRLRLDDVGQGRLAIRDLRHDALDGLKLTSSLTQDLSSDGQSKMLIKALINFGHGLGLDVTVKGTQDQQQFALLKRLGCNAVQLSTIPPMSATAAATWLRAMAESPSSERKTGKRAPEVLMPDHRPLKQGRSKAPPPISRD